MLQEQVDQQRLQEHQHPNRKPQEQQQRSGQGGPGGPGQPQQGQQRWQGGRVLIVLSAWSCIFLPTESLFGAWPCISSLPPYQLMSLLELAALSDCKRSLVSST